MKFENFLVNELPKSKLTVNELYTLSQSSMFKTKTKVRASKVGKIHYVGFKYTYHRDHQGDKKLIVYINLYFYVMGASHKGKREKYLLVAKFPYTTKIKNMKRLYDEPVQIFSSDPSFKYYLTYALNKFNAVITDDLTFVNHLGQSLTQKP
ncbi:MAG: hypothetical protein KAI79_06695, partial [Bacteroidales bacterium]|nr:hypothetical protein [Bacteroidales bacterium]